MVSADFSAQFYHQGYIKEALVLNIKEMVEKILNSLLQKFHQSGFFEGLKKYKI